MSTGFAIYILLILFEKSVTDFRKNIEKNFGLFNKVLFVKINISVGFCAHIYRQEESYGCG
ncbi:hypothetical protein CLOL250_00492 [Clostridium sp. L2-50]|nr:hypothetical protein CLOL250_00492 [Clostridium sp. L2-50]